MPDGVPARIFFSSRGRSSLGFIDVFALLGIVKKNGIMMVDPTSAMPEPSRRPMASFDVFSPRPVSRFT